jgi:urease accessory protein
LTQRFSVKPGAGSLKRDVSDPFLAVLHLCDSLFPVGAFAYSDGLEAAAVVWTAEQLRPPVGNSVAHLRGWMDVALDETIGRLEGPAVWRAWRAFHEERWDVIVALDEELTALRPSLAARRSSRAIGLRLLTTWSILHPDPRLADVMARARDGRLGPTFAVAFAGACACAGVGRRQSVEAFAYTRLAATISAAMRLLPIGQTEAHGLLARALDRVPAVVEVVAQRDAAPESFAPALDIASMSQQYLHSRLFRS